MAFKLLSRPCVAREEPGHRFAYCCWHVSHRLWCTFFEYLIRDKNLRYHGLIQSYSRTNRIYDATKTFGNIVTFRDLEQATIDAITLFGDANTKNVILEKSYKEYMEGFTDVVSGEARRGYVEVVKELEQRFPNPEVMRKNLIKKPSRNYLVNICV